MDSQKRIVLVVLLAGVVAGLTVMLLVKDSSVPGNTRLEGSIALFINNCLPGETTDAQREEIDGILTRFYAKAISGGIYPLDLADIEAELDMYIERGQITRLELNDFMVMIGEATRRMNEEQTPGAE